MEVYYVFAFSERTESMKFFEKLRRRGVYSSLVNTPGVISLGCGLSVRLNRSNFSAACALFTPSEYRTFLGAYEITRDGGRSSARRVLY